MFWNHRVVKIVAAGEPLLLIAEVYYNDETKKPFAYSDRSVCGDTIDEIHETVKRFGAAARQPILSYPEDFEKFPVDDDDDETPIAPV